MPRILARLLAVLGLALLLVGVPVLLWHLTAPPDWLQTDWGTTLTTPGDPRGVLMLLGFAGWVAWIALSVSVVAEGLDLLTHGSVRLRVPGTQWATPAVRALVVAALGSAAIAPMASAEETRPADHHAVAHQDPAAVNVNAKSRAPRIHQAAYVVKAGDELWSIAQRELGSGERWRDIVALNPGVGSDTTLVPGQRLTLPGTPPGPVVVVEGDTLWGLAEAHLGAGERWGEIHAVNEDVISDPDHLEVGWRLRLPGSQGSAETTASQSSAVEPQVTPPPPQPPDAASGTVAPAPQHTQGDHDETARTPATAMEPGDATTSTERTPDAAIQEAQPESDLGPIGGMLAASVVAGVVARRRLQMLDRAVGRRIAPLAPSLERLLTALVRRAEDGSHATGLGPTGVVLGWIEDRPVIHDLESARCTVVDGTPEDVRSMQAAAVTSLACAEWSSPVEVFLVSDHDGWAAALDDPRIHSLASTGEALTELQGLCARRRIEMAQSDLASLRDDPDVAEAWHPVVFILTDRPTAGELDRIEDCLSLGHVGVSVLLNGAGVSDRPAWEMIHIHSGDDASRTSNGDRFQPQLLTAPARRALVDLLGAAASQETESAPWWRDEAHPPVSATPSSDGAVKDPVMPPWSNEPTHPTLLLLGQVQLVGCRGTQPTRARGQCIEYCAWLLERPGSSASTMTRDLVVAEPTRRSNMSRLRTWLGSTPDGQPYLPDAYSGRIRLHPSVTSDWERFQLLLSGGVNAASPQLLREALSIVRGEPMEGVAFQWPWASSLLADMVAMVTDAAVVLAERSMDADDAAMAQWAIAQGRLASPDAEPLLAAEIRLHALVGDHAAVQEKALALSRAARAQGRDLEPGTVRRIQSALHAARVAT